MSIKHIIFLLYSFYKRIYTVLTVLLSFSILPYVFFIISNRKKNKIALNEGQRCIVAYGDASISAGMKSRAPIPVKVIFTA